jgi:hypothetical protein
MGNKFISHEWMTTILALLPEGQRTVIPYLVRIFCACQATGSVPAMWCQVKVVFTSQPGRSSYTGPRELRPISFTSFLLTTMERLVDWYLKDGAPDLMPLHPHQHAYQVGRFVEKALHDLVVQVEVLDEKETALGVFLDRGAFNYISFDSKCTAPNRHEVGHTTVLWIKATLEGRLAKATLSESFMSTAVSRGCPQGGMLSPLLWCLVDELRVRLKEGGVYTQSYTDDIPLLTVVKFPNTVRTHAAGPSHCTDLVELLVNLNNTDLVIYTRKRELPGSIKPVFSGFTLHHSTSAKYLQVAPNSRLT